MPVFVYGLLCYLVFLVAFFSTLVFLLGPGLPGRAAGAPPAGAVVIDLGLVATFGLQHSLMARLPFKRWWTRLVPPAAERSSYVLASSLLLILLVVLWQPIPVVVWRVGGDAGRALLWSLFGVGWVVVLLSTFLISHAELLGLQQVYNHWRDRDGPTAEFKTPWLYKLVRHPMMMGFLVVFWAAPDMPLDRLLFALGMSLYILVGVGFEERDLVGHFGERYLRYRRKTPMLLPGLQWRGVSARSGDGKEETTDGTQHRTRWPPPVSQRSDISKSAPDREDDR